MRTYDFMGPRGAPYPFRMPPPPPPHMVCFDTSVTCIHVRLVVYELGGEEEKKSLLIPLALFKKKKNWVTLPVAN